MSGQVQYEQMRGLPLDAGSRRLPFANTGNQLPAVQTAAAHTPVKPAQLQKKAPGSPPLPRQNTKTAPPSPPQIIRDANHQASYTRVGFLGEVSYLTFIFYLVPERLDRVVLHASMKSRIAPGLVKQLRWLLRTL